MEEDSRCLLSKLDSGEKSIAEVQDARKRWALPIFLIFLLLSGLLVACYPAAMVMVDDSAPSCNTHACDNGVSKQLYTPHPFRSWMADNFDLIKSKTLMEITLPGTHNSGNTNELSWRRMYTQDDNYDAFVSYARASGSAANVTREQFYERFVRWNVNHYAGVGAQLLDGIRWYHLKLCNMNEQPGDFNLDHVFHCHRGFTSSSLAAIVEDMRSFLASHPMEVLVIGANNLYNFDGPTAMADLAAAIASALAPTSALMTATELRELTLGELVAQGKRVALFSRHVAKAEGSIPTLIDSTVHLCENWGAAGDSGNLEEYKSWLRGDIAEFATRRDRYYVLQANPNNNAPAMYQSVLDDAVGTGLYGMEYSLMRGLAPFVLEALRDVPHARINAISTDFIYEARVTELALALLKRDS